MTRTGWLGLLVLLALGAGGALRLAWPSARPALDCDPAQVRWVDVEGTRVATCGPPGAPEGSPPAGAALALGRKLDLNRANEEELRLISGVGPKLARELVEARAARGGFKSWDEVDEVPGVGPARLAQLKEAADLLPPSPRNP